jgi:hypothetical protein
MKFGGVFWAGHPVVSTKFAKRAQAARLWQEAPLQCWPVDLLQVLFETANDIA